MPALVITPADVLLISGTSVSKANGDVVTISAGDLVTLVNDQAVLANKSTQVLSGQAGLYLAVNTAAPGQPVSLALPNSVIDLGVAPILGSVFVVGANGEIIQEVELVENEWLSIAGYGNSSDYFVFLGICCNTQIPGPSSLV